MPPWRAVWRPDTPRATASARLTADSPPHLRLMQSDTRGLLRDSRRRGCDRHRLSRPIGERIVHCLDCGYLSIQAWWLEVWRAHRGYHEAEKYYRDNPRDAFKFVPGETNA